jgi:putative ABC transport system substrate-binding protein
MTRRLFLATAAAAFLPGAWAQARKTVKVGMLGPTALERSVWAGPLVQRLAELGYRDGAGMILAYRASEGAVEHYRKQARELIAEKCDLIYALGPEAPVRALQDARSTIPVVFIAVDFDPLEKGIVASLRQPDRNTTGIFVPQGALVAKRLEMMRDVLPRARRFLTLGDEHSRDQLAPLREAAKGSGIELIVVEFTTHPYDLEEAFETGRRAKVEALVGLASPVLNQRRNDIARLLSKHRLPGIGSTQSQAGAGFLLSLGPDIGKTTRRAAEIGVRILKGAKPQEIPVEQADEFELVINSKTAAALAVKIPERVLARATKIIS